MSESVGVIEPAQLPPLPKTAATPQTASYLSRDDFDVFVREYADRLQTVAARILRSPEDAADAVQDALLSAYRARHRFRGQSTVYTWLYRIVANTCLIQLRSRRARKRRHVESRCSLDETPRDLADTSVQSPIAAMERAEAAVAIHIKLEQLPDDYRVILLLRDVEGLDTSETARRLRISSDAVKTRVCRARQALRLLLESNHSLGPSRHSKPLGMDPEKTVSN